MRIDILTLFPDMCNTVMQESIIGRAQKSGAITVCARNIRDYSKDKHHKVDDTPYGGGRGMLMMAPPIYDCYAAIAAQTEGLRRRVIYMSPKGRVLNHEIAMELSAYEHIIILCGHYEGVDQRALDLCIDREISIGDYVVTGGELPAMILADAVSRMLPGVLADEQGFIGESHYSSLLEYPQYTKPAVWHEREVPEVLSSGHHAKIEEWQREQSLERTFLRRPELLEKTELSEKDKKILAKIKEKHSMK